MTAATRTPSLIARRLAGPSLLTVLMLALLISLGLWQVHRLAWKTAILASIAAAERNPPVPLADPVAAFARVSVTGTLGQGSAAYADQVNDTPQGPKMGSQLLRLLNRPGHKPILVDLGWVPEGTLVPPAAAPVTIVGFVRPAEQSSWKSAVDSPAARRFYTLDPTPIGAALGDAEVAPFTLVAMGHDHPGVYPQPAEALPQPVNNHLSYALTWFGLAVVLVVVLAMHAISVLRA